MILYRFVGMENKSIKILMFRIGGGEV